MRKADFCLCEKQRRSSAVQLLHTDSTMPLLLKSEISSFWPSSVAAQSDLCQTSSETLKTGFLATRLI